MFAITPDTGLTLPSLRSLAEVIGWDAWLAQVPEAVQSIEDLRLGRFEIEIDAARHALTGLTLEFILPRPIAFSDGIKSKSLLDRFPDDRLLAEIEQGIDKGIDRSIPTLVSAGFETGTGFVDPAGITLTATVLVPERGEKKLAMTVDLTDPAAVADAVGKALVKLIKPA